MYNHTDAAENFLNTKFEECHKRCVAEIAAWLSTALWADKTATPEKIEQWVYDLMIELGDNPIYEARAELEAHNIDADSASFKPESKRKRETLVQKYPNAVHVDLSTGQQLKDVLRMIPTNPATTNGWSDACDIFHSHNID